MTIPPGGRKVKSDIDSLLAKARNQSSAGCKVTAALNTLPPADRAKIEAALMERSTVNPRHWAYVADKLAAVIDELAPGSQVTGNAVRTYRTNRHG